MYRPAALTSWKWAYLLPRHVTSVVGAIFRFNAVVCVTVKENMVLIFMVRGQDPPGLDPPGHDPPAKIPLGQDPPRQRSPQGKIPPEKIPLDKILVISILSVRMSVNKSKMTKLI